MEINNLKHFLHVAELESVNKAANKHNLSPGTLSKAISKLEQELKVLLFERVGRNIRLTNEGRVLQKRATKIIDLEESTRIELGGDLQDFKVVICGEELILSYFGVLISEKISKIYPNATFEFISCSSSEAVKKVEYGEAHLALTTSKPNSLLKSKQIEKSKSLTVVGKKHPLSRFAKNGKAIPVQELLDYDFALPSKDVLGLKISSGSEDGWRDDKFKRKLTYKVNSFNIVESLLVKGKAVAYLPDYLAEEKEILVLKVDGCPYQCVQNIYMHCRDPKEIGWLNQIW